jgi:putative addiction module killer protein
MNIESTREFDVWIFGLDEKTQSQVNDRLDRIREHNHFGDKKYLDDSLFELRWKNGRRIYYSLIEDDDGSAALMLLGGSKNGQNRDSVQARKILEREAS